MQLKVEYLENYNPAWGELAYQHPTDAGFDLRAAIDAPIVLKAGAFATIPLGMRWELVPDKPQPPFMNYEIQVRPRSGLASKHGISMVNTPGTVDIGYRGEVKVILINHGAEDFTINPGDRIGQAFVCPLMVPAIVRVAHVDTNTPRGTGGFGSTGKA